MNDTPTAPEQQDATEPVAQGARPVQPPSAQPPAEPEGASPAQPRYAPPQYAPPQYAPPATPLVAAQPGFAEAPQHVYAPPRQLQPEYMQRPAYAPAQNYPQSYPAPPYPVQPNPYAVLHDPGPGEPFDGAGHPADLSRPLYGANFAQAWGRFFKNYATFSGRASRSEFWWIVLTLIGAWLALGVLGGLLEGATRSSYGARASYDAVTGLLGLVVLVVIVGLFIPILSLTWRRLHDADLPGGFYFLILIPFLGGLALTVMLALPPKVSGRRYYRSV